MTRICVEDHDGASVSLGSMVTSRVGNPYFFTGRRLDVLDVSDNGTPHRFTDDVAGLTIYDFRARRMDPVLGRFSQRDPLEYVDGIGLYEYCGGIPVWFVDPLGLEVGEPGTLESFIPVWGSGRQAINDFQTGNYAWAAFNGGMAVSDVFLVKAVGTGLAKGAFKVGSHTWSATSKWLTKTGWREFAGQEMHHWFVPQSGWGKYVPDLIKNQPWNIMPMPSAEFHRAIHGLGIHPFSAAEQIWYGTPGWFKALLISTFGRFFDDLRDENECN